MEYLNKGVLKDAISIVVGALISILVITPFAIIAAFMIFSEARIPKSQEIMSDIILLLGVTIGTLVGGGVTAKLSFHKSMVMIIIFSGVLVLLYLFTFEFEFSYLSFSEFLVIPLMIIFACLGGYLHMKKKSENNKLPLDNNDET